jgi:hypothetical protein
MFVTIGQGRGRSRFMLAILVFGSSGPETAARRTTELASGQRGWQGKSTVGTTTASTVEGIVACIMGSSLAPFGFFFRSDLGIGIAKWTLKSFAHPYPADYHAHVIGEDRE